MLSALQCMNDWSTVTWISIDSNYSGSLKFNGQMNIVFRFMFLHKVELDSIGNTIFPLELFFVQSRLFSETILSVLMSVSYMK